MKVGESKPPVRSIADRNKLVEDNLRIVPWALFKMRPTYIKLARRYGYSDMIQEGRIILMRAADLWEPKKGKFSTYATACIRKGMLGVHRKLKGRDRILATSISEMKGDSWQPPLANQGISHVERLYMREVFNLALKGLTWRQRTALELRIGWDDGEEYTLEETGRIMRITKERVRQLHAGAINKLKHPVRTNFMAISLGFFVCKCERWGESHVVCRICKKPWCDQCVSHRQSYRYNLNLHSCEKCWDAAVLKQKRIAAEWDAEWNAYVTLTPKEGKNA